MSYHTGVNRKFYPLEFGKSEKVWGNDSGFEVYKWQNRLYLVRDGYQLAELVQGYISLKNSYKNDFNVWIDKVRKKDEKKINGIKEKIRELNSDIELIESMWRD